MSDTQVPLLPTHYYHIYNHAIGSEKLFKRDADYVYFLKKTEQHLKPVCTLLSFCLMPNHFHFVVQIKPEIEIYPFEKANEAIWDLKNKPVKGAKVLSVLK